MSKGRILALSGGVGGAKLALGLSRVIPDENLVIVANTGDDFEHLGLHISPDLDTLLYTLAGINDPETGWGREGETWSCISLIGKLGGESWFRLGDKDLALHLYRTARLKAGQSLSAVTSELRRHLGIGPEVVPMSDQPVRTEVETAQGPMPFQRYFVQERCEPAVSAIRFAGAEAARPTTTISDLLASPSLRSIVICPSNPYLSIDPILAIPEVRDTISNARAPVIAVSPIVGGAALKGPTAKLMSELGVPVSAKAVADHYAGLADGLVLDRADAGLQDSIEAAGMRCLVTNTVMTTLEDRVQVATDVLAFAETLGTSD